jgi:hypothetical protein
MTDGKDLTGFNETRSPGTSPWATESYTEAPKSAFPAKDMSTQGNSGLGQEGSAGANESGADFSDKL